jgi:hypothetical protein
MVFQPYLDIFKPSGEGVAMYSSKETPPIHYSMAESSFIHMRAAVQRAIDEGKITEANTYIVTITGRFPVKARQFIVIKQKGTLQIFAPTPPSHGA